MNMTSGLNDKRGHLSKYDINEECKKNSLIIYPKDERCLKLASYDITPTIIAMSTKIGMLERVYREKSYHGDKYYIIVHPKDTVLIVSNEYIQLPEYMAGYVSSRVSKAVEGFGHISTTIDPKWSGAALIAVSNPTNRALKIYVGSAECNRKPNQLATVTFHYLNSECEKEDKPGDYSAMRLDLLKRISYSCRTGIRAWISRHLRKFRREFTDYFMEAGDDIIESLKKGFDENTWDNFINEFSKLKDVSGQNHTTIKQSRKARKCARDFVISESIFTRLYRAIGDRKNIIFLILMFVWLIYAAVRGMDLIAIGGFGINVIAAICDAMVTPPNID